jgi:HD-like signal output (HDOD) protein
MAFASGGQEALDILKVEPFDLIVTDMRMPGMDGAQLLTEVMNRYPQIVRIVLSGQSDLNTILKSVRPAHQYLSKPCDTKILKSTVARAFAFRDLLADNSLKKLVSQIESLPSLPSLYVEIMEVMRSPASSVQKVGEIISRDISMTAKILQLVNSAFFGLCRHVSSPAQAVSLLGMEIVKALVLSVQIFSQFDQAKLDGFSLEGLWDHSIRSSVFAKAIAKEEGKGQYMIDDAFMAGMLHDLGKMVLILNLPERYGEALDVARGENRFLWEVELEILGATHAEIGAYLMGLWGLPSHVVEAIGFHHNPRKCLDREFSPLTAVHVGDALEHERREPERVEVKSRLDSEYLAELAMVDRLSLWQEKCKNSIEQGDQDVP